MILPEPTLPELTETLALLEEIGAICMPDPDGERLHVKAPRGALTAELQERIRQWKLALLAHFANQTNERCHCGAPVEYYNSRGQPFCKRHRYQAAQQQCAATPGLVRITQSSFFMQDVAEVREEMRAEGEPVALDLETTGLHPKKDRVVAIILGVPGKVSILDLRPYYGLPEEEKVAWRESLAVLLTQPHITWVGHNLKFDWQFLAANFGVRLSHVYDTMLAEQLIHGVGLHDPALSVSLQKTAARYEIAVTKEQRAWFPGLDQRPQEWKAPFPTEQLTYMVQDVEVAYQLYTLQEAKLHTHHLEAVTALENEALPAVAAMELQGICIDTAHWREILKRKQLRQEGLEQRVRTVLGQALQTTYNAHQDTLRTEEKRLMQAYQQAPGNHTWQSFRQTGLSAWLKKHPPVPAPSKTGINLASHRQLHAALIAAGVQVSSTREADLEQYAKDSPIIAELMEWRKLEKFRSAFGENILAKIDADGRLRTSYAQIGAVSGRIICSNPNLQQMPAKETDEEENLRSCFVAPPGSLILKADLSNIELRILAEVAHDPVMLRLFAEGRDLHAETAKMMFDLPPETDTKKHLYKGGISARAVAKTINFGLAYGMGAQGLANRIGCFVEDAKALVEAYFATYAGIAAWLRQAGQQAKKQGYAVTQAGRRRWFDFDLDEFGTMERSAKNHPIQGTNADILKCALALLYEALPEGASLILAVHDELVIECPEALVPQVEELMKEKMVQACRRFLKVVHIPAPDVVVAPYWKKDE
jgi:DNA polymerase-1